MTKRRPPRFSGEDWALWEKVAQTAKPLGKQIPLDGDAPTKPTPKTKDGKRRDPTSRNVERSRPTPKAPILEQPKVAMDRRKYQRMTRGKINPEARIDLHGMTVAAAHSALMSFIFRADAEGKRLVLVITGKGRGIDHDGPIPQRRGILRQQVPHWLAVPPLDRLVLQISPAHNRHGGEGAYYVYLRRR